MAPKPHADRGAFIPYVIGVIAIGAVISPALESPPTDSFPLSNFPMFSSQKTADATLDHVVGKTADGTEITLTPALIANDEILQAKVTVRDTVRRGPAATRQLCTEVAARVAQSSAHAEVAHIEVRRATYDAVKYFTEGAPASQSKLYARCSVARGHTEAP